MKKVLVVLLGMAVCFDAIAEEAEEVELPPIVVSPTRYESALGSIPSSITVISEEDVESEAKPLVKDVLKYVPGVDIVETSAFGGTTSVYTRGTDSSHTLVMIDGIKVFNPMSTDGSFNLANLTLDNVERIEILRGTHSTVYGSDAIGGVIDIITKKGSGKPKVWASFEGGSYATLKEAVGSDGEMNGLCYSAAVSRIDTRGISKADGKFDNGERDAYHNTSVSGRVDYAVFKNLAIGSTFRRTDAEIKVDDSGGYGGDDPNRRDREINTIVSAYGDCSVFDWWKIGFKSSWMKYEFFDKDKGDESDPGEYLNSKFTGRTSSYEGHSILELCEYDTLSAGIDYSGQEGDSFSDLVDSVWGPWFTDSPRTKNHDIGYFLQNKFDVEDRFHSIAGFRIDDHSEFGAYDTYEISGKYIFDSKTSIRGKWATGFKAPSLFQLYDPSNGNPNLRPEESMSFEAGAGQELFEGRLKLESVYFHTKLENLIDWVATNTFLGTGQYFNVNKAAIDGIESQIALKPFDNLTVGYMYTFLDARNELTHQYLNRRPRNKHALTVNFTPLENMSFNVLYLYVGGRKDVMWDNNFVKHQIDLKHYNKVDVSGRYAVNKNFEIFGRVENLLNQFYEEVDGYGMPGIAFYAGCKAMF